MSTGIIGFSSVTQYVTQSQVSRELAPDSAFARNLPEPHAMTLKSESQKHCRVLWV